MPYRRTALYLLTSICLTFHVQSCAEEKPIAAAEKPRPVKAIVLKKERRQVRIEYIGTTGSQAIKKYSFKLPGKISKIFVEKGAPIIKGQKIARLNKTEVGYAVEASELDVRKAENAFEESKRFYEKIEKLHEQGVVSQANLDKAKLDRDIKESINAQAKVGYASKQTLMSDTVMVADIDGFVVEVLNEAGEMVGAGYPVVIVRGQTQIVNVGVSQRDIKMLEIGTRALVTVDEATGHGEITKISQIPDMQSRTYNVEIALTGALGEKEFYIGSIANVSFEIGEDEGIWVPVDVILTDGVDYVFIEKNGRAVRANITVGQITGNRAKVEGLTEGTRLLVEGMKTLKEGYLVSVQ